MPLKRCLCLTGLALILTLVSFASSAQEIIRRSGLALSEEEDIQVFFSFQRDRELFLLRDFDIEIEMKAKKKRKARTIHYSFDDVVEFRRAKASKNLGRPYLVGSGIKSQFAMMIVLKDGGKLLIHDDLDSVLLDLEAPGPVTTVVMAEDTMAPEVEHDTVYALGLNEPYLKGEWEYSDWLREGLLYSFSRQIADNPAGSHQAAGCKNLLQPFLVIDGPKK
jgi:hypothetical protein